MVVWKDGTLVTPAHVNEDGTITPAVYEGETPLSAELLNLMQKVDTKSITLTKGTVITNNKEITLPLNYQVR